MTTIQQFIQNGGYISQEGGLKVSVKKFFENLIVTQDGIYDKKKFDTITLNNSIDKKIVDDTVKFKNITTKKFNLGLDRILDGEIENIEPIYSISIKYMDFNININIEGKEDTEQIINNYGLIISFLHKNYNLDENIGTLNPVNQTVKVIA